MPFSSYGFEYSSIPSKFMCFSLIQEWYGIKDDPKGRMREWKSEIVVSSCHCLETKCFSGVVTTGTRDMLCWFV